MNDSSQLAARLDHLEAENRRWRRLGLCASLGCVALVALGLGPRREERRSEETVEARRFVLVDAAGKESAVLEHDPQGFPHLLLSKGDHRAFLTANGPGLLLRGKEGKRGAYLGIDGRGASQLELCSELLYDGVRLSVKEDGSSGIYLLDETGRDRAAIDLPKGGGPAFQVRDSDSRLRAQLGVDPRDNPNVILLDSLGRRRAGMVIDGTGTPLFAMEDERGRPRVQLTTLFDGTPELKLLNADGKSAFEAP